MATEPMNGQHGRTGGHSDADAPNPGSDAAVDRGCTCPVIDNRHGAGAWEFEGEVHWWRTEGCPLHGFERPEPQSGRTQ